MYSRNHSPNVVQVCSVLLNTDTYKEMTQRKNTPATTNSHGEISAFAHRRPLAVQDGFVKST